MILAEPENVRRKLADKHLSVLFIWLAFRFEQIISFRGLTTRALATTIPAERERLRQSFTNMSLSIYTGETEAEQLESKQRILGISGGFGAMADSRANHQHAQHVSSANAAALVFGHSAVESIVDRLCEISALVDTEWWLDRIGERKVSLNEIRNRPATEIVNEHIAKRMIALRKDSLSKKFALVTDATKPVGLTLTDGFKLDPSRLQKLDELRHEVVHGVSGFPEIPTIENDLDFFNRTGALLILAASQAYDLKVDGSGFTGYFDSGSTLPPLFT
jgi:hypothetical protein